MEKDNKQYYDPYYENMDVDTFNTLYAKKEQDSKLPRRICIGALSLLLIGGAGYAIHGRLAENVAEFNLKANRQMELGEPVYLRPETFLNANAEEDFEDYRIESCLMDDAAHFTFDKATKKVTTKGKEYLEAGKYEIELSKGKHTETVDFKVTDTKAPDFLSFSKKIYIEQYATNVDLAKYWKAKDLSDAVIHVEGEVDFDTAGTYIVQVIARDKFGNEKKEEAEVNIVSREAIDNGSPITLMRSGRLPETNEQKEKPVEMPEKKDEVQIGIPDILPEREPEPIIPEQGEIDEPEEPVIELKQGWSEDGLQYFLDDVAVTGYQTIDDKFYYFDEESANKQFGWIHLEDVDYYANPDTGILATGTQEIEGSIYLFEENGELSKKESFTAEHAIYSVKDGKIVKTVMERDVYLNQNDYGNGMYACVPTSIAIAINHVNGSNITPDPIREYMIEKGYYINDKGSVDTSGYEDTGSHFDVEIKGLNDDKQMIIQSLLKGKAVLAHISCTPFVAPEAVGPTDKNAVHHAMTLIGYDSSNDMVYVLDPYTKEFSGWYKLDTIIAGESKIDLNTMCDGPFFEVGKK